VNVLALTGAALLSCSAVLASQGLTNAQAPTASLFLGTVYRESTGTAVAGASVYVRVGNTNVASTRSDGDGNYVLSAIAASARVGAVDQAGQYSDTRPATPGVPQNLVINDPTTHQTNVSGNVAARTVLYVTDRSHVGAMGPFGNDRSSPWRSEPGSYLTYLSRTNAGGACPTDSGFSCSFLPASISPISNQIAQRDLRTLLRSEIAARHAHRVLLFIHGFNVTFEDALQAAAQITLNGAVVDGKPWTEPVLAFSWPSYGKLALYVADANNAQLAYSHLEDALAAASSVVGPGNVDVVAHSMGSQVLFEAFRDVVNGHPPLRLGHVFMAAPDVDTELFLGLAARLQSITTSVTVYTSTYDEALKASSCLHGRVNRLGVAGITGPTLQGVEFVNVSNVKTQGLGHSYITDTPEVAQDIARVIMGLSRPNIIGAGSQKRIGATNENHSASVNVYAITDALCSGYYHFANELQSLLNRI
jgi:esterase/lipase superfamily enzyme